MTQAQGSGARRDSELGLDDPQASAASRRRPRDRVILTQPPPPRPTPSHSAPDDEEVPASPSTGSATGDERREELLADIDELVDGG